jgi:hypothetical protein
MPTRRQQRLRELTLTPGALDERGNNINKKEGRSRLASPSQLTWNLCTLMECSGLEAIKRIFSSRTEAKRCPRCCSAHQT